MTYARMRVAFCTYLTNARNCHAEKVDCPFSISIFSFRNQMKQKRLKCYKQLSNDHCRRLDNEFLIISRSNFEWIAILETLLHIFPKAQVTPNKSVHKTQTPFLGTVFNGLIHLVCIVRSRLFQWLKLFNSQTDTAISRFLGLVML